MSDIKLNRKRPFGVVYGDSNVTFVQDGRSFRGDGSLVGQSEEAPPPPPEVSQEQDLIADRNRRRAETMKKRWAARREAAK